MHRVPLRLVTAGLFLILGSPSALADEGDRGAGWWGGLDRGQVVELQDVIVDPRHHTGREITFFCIVRGKDDVFVPRGTIFSRRKYTNVSIWPDGAPLWEAANYQKYEFPFLYIRSSHEQRDQLVRLEKFTRIEVTGAIRSIYRDKPFIEIVSWRETGHRLGREVVDAMAWGDIYARGGKIELAAAKYKEALRVDLPPLYDIAVRKRAADAMRKLGYADFAGEIERGETLGGTDMPEPTVPETTMPDERPPSGFAPVESPGVGFAPPTGGADGPTPIPASPAVHPSNPFLPTEMPGEPVHRIEGDPERPDTSTADVGSQASPAPSNPFFSEDMPGTPVNADPAASRGKVEPRANAARPGAAPDAGVGFPAATPAATPAAKPASTPAGAVAPVRGRAKRPVLPPSRRPRLVGVR